MHRPVGAAALLVAATSVTPAAAKVAEGWLELPPLPTARQEVGVAALEEKVYVIGGILADRTATGRVERFDVGRFEWEDVPSLPGGVRLHHVGAAAVEGEGKLYAIGGLGSGFRAVRSVFSFDPTANDWEPVADLPWPRGAMGVAALDGRIYVAGGQDGSATFRDFARYDPAEDRWEELPDMPTARNHLAAAAHEGLFYAVGGRAGRLFGTLEVFEPASGEWRTLAPMPTARGGIAAAVLEGEIFVFGGEGAARPTGVFPQTESYDVARDRWSARTDMATPRHGIGAAAVGELIHIPGGSPVEGFGVTDVHDAFQPGSTVFGFLRGDANGDGKVDISDPVQTLTFLFIDRSVGLPCADAADTDDNGAIQVTDAIVTLNFLFLGGEPPREPGPFERGRDPTADKLGCEGF